MKVVHRQLVNRQREIVTTMVGLARSRLIDVHQQVGSIEYVRLSSFEICAHEVVVGRVAGAMAEVGVYQGDFARMMNAALPDKTLYLFDTFAGFDPGQEDRDRSTLGLTHRRDFADTSVDLVLGRMPHRDRCVVRPGLFPASAEGLEETFCLVSLDADLFEPIYEGLRYFYPRLAAGGYIFVHDYNNSTFPGSKHAVRQFSLETGVPFVPLTDMYGTAVLAK